MNERIKDVLELTAKVLSDEARDNLTVACSVSGGRLGHIN